MQNSTYRQNYVVHMSLCRHGIMAEVNDVMMQFA